MMDKRVIAAALLVAVAAPATSAAESRLRVTPKPAKVTDEIVVSFVVKRQLRRGYRYNALLLGESCSTGANFVGQVIARRPAKGRRLTVRFRPQSDPLAAETSRWCAGDFTVSIASSRASDGKNTRVEALGSGRFVG